MATGNAQGSGMLTAIETHYDGHRFRSRLEARWAVFFNALGIKYEYEPEGYEFAGQKYLPDFWIPSWDAFVEIKPAIPDYDQMSRLIAFAQHANKNLLVIYDGPYVKSHHVIWCSPLGFEGHQLQLGWCCYAKNGCGQLYVHSPYWGAQAIGPLTDHDCMGLAFLEPERRTIDGLLDGWPFIGGFEAEAFEAATSARFEYGESG